MFTIYIRYYYYSVAAFSCSCLRRRPNHSVCMHISLYFYIQFSKDKYIYLYVKFCRGAKVCIVVLLSIIFFIIPIF